MTICHINYTNFRLFLQPFYCYNLIKGVDRVDKIKKNKEISPKKNLQKIREDNHYSQRKVAEDNNTYQEVISRLESGTRTSNIEFIMQLANYFHCSTDYLLDCRTSSIKSSNENELIRIFRSLSPEQQDLYLEQGKAFLKINAKENSKSSKSTSQNGTNVG